MAFWLAIGRTGQDSDWIQRFDPRFWTVNFPRPMMASVTVTAPDGLRVDCDFHREGDLAGLIWESADRFDHPLLAYAEDRDYSRTTLRFRWRSGGLIALDQPNGPTLTIEGRDAQGAPRSWYVRLWNYATGTPEDALIELPFSALEGGFGLPGEPVHPGDIDRLFISLVPPGYVAASTMPLPAPLEGWAELSAITCEGDRPLIAIGDVILPPHGEQAATGYDDAYNLTPDRLLRTIRGLGYRGEVLHYVGMSHYFRLEPLGSAHYVSLAGGVLNAPCAAWHRAFAALASASGYRIIWSLSYELLDQHCWNDWKQRAHDGTPAQTGWEPPSALLSPAHGGAMAYLRQVAEAFARIAVDAGMALAFQIGEPWWWVIPSRRAPCLYDDAARAALGGNPPLIADLGVPLDAAQTALLDAAGTLLAQSTFALRDAVKAVGGAGAEVMILVFTPTVLDPAMPDLRRASLPPGWARPAFDRLQLEDYDWLTAGEDARRVAGYAQVDARLGYPLAQQDYLAGFVLAPEGAGQLWQRIDRGLDEAAARGITRRFVWAMPQVARDGYVRLPPALEDSMQAFDDVLYPLALGRDASVSPEFATSVAVTASGHERRSSLWADARLGFDVGPGLRSDAELGVLIAFFRARRGAARAFRLADPFDHSSNGMTGTPTPADQLIGLGDGTTSRFALIKAYGDEAEPQLRAITRPRPDSVRVSVAGAEAGGWSLVERGWITFAEPPPAGAEVRAGFLFDVTVRFAQDRLDIAGANFAAGEAPSVPLIEVREVR